MTRTWTLRAVLAANAALLFLALNPWLDRWSGEALAALALEAAGVVVVGLPMVLFQVVVRDKPPGRAARDAVEAVMDFLTGAA